MVVQNDRIIKNLIISYIKKIIDYISYRFDYTDNIW